MMPLPAPLSISCSNPGVHDRWTCPACYTDLDARRPGTVVCPTCQHTVVLSLEEQSVCASEIIIDGDADA